MITLTIEQIKDLAEFAGLIVTNYDLENSETEITIEKCTEISGEFYDYIAYYTEYYDEGCFPLGRSLKKR